MKSVARIYDGIEQDRISQIVGAVAGQPVISANLCEALLKLQPADDRAAVNLGVSWAPMRPAPEMASVPRFVKFRREHFERIAELRTRLLPPPPARAGTYFGFVEELHGEPGEDGRRRGDVEVMIMQEGGAMEFALVNLSADWYAQAASAHMQSAVVRVRGILERQARVHRIKDVTHFGIVPDQAGAAA